MLYQNSFKNNEESALLITSLSHAISRLSVIFPDQYGKSSKDGEWLQHKRAYS